MSYRINLNTPQSMTTRSSAHAGRLLKMRVLALSAGLTMAAAGNLSAQQSRALLPHEELARTIYAEMIAIDSSNPDGNTTAVAEVARRHLLAAGFPESDVLLFEPEERQGNLVATLRGRNPELKPIVLVAHLDVVVVEALEWNYPPFELTEVDGIFYGRGTADDKDEASIHVANLIRMKQEGFIPERDLVVALTSGEEGGGLNGVGWLLDNQRELIDGWFAINEGGGGQLDNEGSRVSHTIQVAEKSIQSFTFRVTNAGGHSARPRRDNAIVFLAEALARLGEHRFPVLLSDITRSYLERSAPQFPPAIGRAMLTLLTNPADPEANRLIEEINPTLNATLRTTCIPTMIEGGHASNAAPQIAEATINCRLLPEDDPEDVHRILRELAGPEVEVLTRSYAAEKPTSPVVPEIFDPIERLSAEMWPGIPVVPLVGTGATDGTRFRQAGIPVYGLNGVFAGETNAHGADEQTPVDGYFGGLEFLYRLLKELTE